MKQIEVAEISQRVKRISHRIKNADNSLLHKEALLIANCIARKKTPEEALLVEKSFINKLEVIYSVETPTGISIQAPVTNLAADAYGDDDSSAIDYDQIAVFEGGQQIQGYVPTDSNGDTIGKSGVTISTGVDIGQMSEDQINNLDIPQTLKDKLFDYAGLIGQDATDALDKTPLNISDEEADQLDKTINEKTTNELINSFDSKSEGVGFTDLPGEMQTAIASVAYQYGNIAAKCPQFWSDITENRWSDAEDELRDFKDSYSTRRNAEADLFHTGIEKLNSIKDLPDVKKDPPTRIA